MLRLAEKAFYPEPVPFPLMHIDTGWKFKEMIEFRDRIMKEKGLDLIVYRNEEGISRGINPFDHGAARMKLFHAGGGFVPKSFQRLAIRRCPSVYRFHALRSPSEKVVCLLTLLYKLASFLTIPPKAFSHISSPTLPHLSRLNSSNLIPYLLAY